MKLNEVINLYNLHSDPSKLNDQQMAELMKHVVVLKLPSNNRFSIMFGFNSLSKLGLDPQDETVAVNYCNNKQDVANALQQFIKYEMEETNRDPSKDLMTHPKVQEFARLINAIDVSMMVSWTSNLYWTGPAFIAAIPRGVERAFGKVSWT